MVSLNVLTQLLCLHYGSLLQECPDRWVFLEVENNSLEMEKPRVRAFYVLFLLAHDLFRITSS